MPSLNIEQFGDLLVTTLAKFQKPDYVNLVTDLVDFPAAKSLVKKSRMKLMDGKNVDWKVKMQTGNSFRNISITAQDSVNIVDGFVSATANWRKSEVKYAFYEEEMTINRGESELVDLIKSREDGAAYDWIEGIENNFWRFPSASDTVTPLGAPYWITKNATTGFSGGIPTGYTDVAGISPTTYPRWNNYTAQDSGTTLDDFVRKVRVMCEATGFKPPVAAVPDLGKAGRRGFFTTLTRKTLLEDLVDSRNDNLGNDLAKNDNAVIIRGIPVTYVPRLDEDTTNPFYQIDWDNYKIAVQNGWWQKRKTISPYPGQRNVSAVFMDTLYQFICFSRRNCGVIASGVTYPS